MLFFSLLHNSDITYWIKYFDKIKCYSDRPYPVFFSAWNLKHTYIFFWPEWHWVRVMGMIFQGDLSVRKGVCELVSLLVCMRACDRAREWLCEWVRFTVQMNYFVLYWKAEPPKRRFMVSRISFRSLQLYQTIYQEAVTWLQCRIICQKDMIVIEVNLNGNLSIFKYRCLIKGFEYYRKSNM